MVIFSEEKHKNNKLFSIPVNKEWMIPFPFIIIIHISFFLKGSLNSIRLFFPFCIFRQNYQESLFSEVLSIYLIIIIFKIFRIIHVLLLDFHWFPGDFSNVPFIIEKSLQLFLQFYLFYLPIKKNWIKDPCF